MMSVATPQPPAYSPKSANAAAPGAANAVPSCTSDVAVEYVTELTSPAALDDALLALGAVGGDGAEGPKLVLVEAYTTSCRACIGVKRIYERVAEEQHAVVRCFRFDAFNCGNLAQKLGVRGLPTFLVYKRSAEPGENGYEWRRVDHFTTSKRSAIEQNINDNL